MCARFLLGSCPTSENTWITFGNSFLASKFQWDEKIEGEEESYFFLQMNIRTLVLIQTVGIFPGFIFSSFPFEFPFV